MGSLSIWHWVVAIFAIASPIMGIVRSVQNGAALHAILSAFIPLYGLVYFIVSKHKNT